MATKDLSSESQGMQPYKDLVCRHDSWLLPAKWGFSWQNCATLLTCLLLAARHEGCSSTPCKFALLGANKKTSHGKPWKCNNYYFLQGPAMSSCRVSTSKLVACPATSQASQTLGNDKRIGLQATIQHKQNTCYLCAKHQCHLQA